jgi:hypothetical protein
MRPASVTTPGGTAASSWLPLDHLTSGYGDGLYCKVTGTATYSVEVTPDNIFDSAVTPQAYPCDIVALTAATTTQSGSLLKAARAVRVNQASGAGTVTLTAVVRGL